MSAIWEDAQVNSRAELLLLLALGDYANDKGECWPSIETLAKKARCKQRAIQNLVASLIISGKLEVEYNAGPRGTNVYRLIMGGCSGCGGASSREKKQEIKSEIKKQPDAPDPSGSVSNHQSTSVPVIEIIPEALKTPEFLASWEEWKTFRKSHKSKSKNYAIMFRKQMEMLSKYTAVEATGMLEESMRNGWQGLFPPKQQSNYGRRAPAPNHQGGW